jgi:putative membrane protein insertion efficiency factor
MKPVALLLIRLYQQTLSQVTPPSCRFVPSCSQYGNEAIDK